jgi:hypothetical protein
MGYFIFVPMKFRVFVVAFLPTSGLSDVLVFEIRQPERKPLEIMELKLCNAAGIYSFSPDKS